MCHGPWTMASLKDRVSRERMERLYLVEKLSTTQIADRLGTNRESVRRLIKNYGLPMRQAGYPFDKRKE